MKFKLFHIFSLALCAVSYAYSMENFEELTDPEKLVSEINQVLNAGGTTQRNYGCCGEKNLKIAAALYARYYIIGQQDAACCYDTGTKDCLKRWVQKQPFHSFINRHIPPTELNQIFQEQCAWVEQQTEKNDIQHSLGWVGRFSWDSFGDTPRAIKIPKEQWKEKRTAALVELKREFTKE